MKLRHWGLLAALVAAFAAGTKAGIEYAKNTYVSRNRKFIEGKVTNKEE